MFTGDDKYDDGGHEVGSFAQNKREAHMTHDEEIALVRDNPGLLSQMFEHVPGKRGEFLVIQKLRSLGVRSVWHDPFAKESDVLAHLPDGPVSIEVKATSNRCSSWPVRREPDTTISRFWVLISGARTESPEFWVLTVDEAQEAWQLTVKGQRQRGRVEGDIFKSVLQRLEIRPGAWGKITG
ncbi:hypothetical protein PAF17_19390 [Paracoccus sp. Z330]|uniref:Protein NO VEIN C-terminal domain-containing protein n=1 Tax=Paracoccus onchidii TaxID=3017813 RepID=A0ABT4ZJW3_9RHOB|nr:hypothetical protein [Paracoccus onchidii]MDB6179631.1 hypothetical protein [Paracoccus onchidii]